MAKIYCKSSYLLRKDTAENWQNKNPILRKGEQGLETDTGIIKIGDGATEYNSLSDDNIYLPKSYANATFANALKGSKSGSAIFIDDVSPVTHEMGVKISSNTVTDLTAVKVIKSNASGEAVSEYTPTADGTVNGITSLYPSTTLTTDTECVLIDCEYNRDINKAFAELQQAIISLGGNV